MKKIALITGSSRGIGKQCALIFSKNDYFVVLTYKSSRQSALKVLEEIQNQGNEAMLIQADLAKTSDCIKLVNTVKETLGKVDVLINNAGISLQKLLIDCNEKEINDLISVNLTAPILLSREISKIMIKNNFGRIINISSIWGEIGGSMESVYSATKGGLISFTKALAKELALANITVNSISPGAVETDMLHEISDKDLIALKNEIPVGRFAQASEVAQLALFLASDKASYITAQNIGINGGLN